MTWRVRSRIKQDRPDRTAEITISPVQEKINRVQGKISRVQGQIRRMQGRIDLMQGQINRQQTAAHRRPETVQAFCREKALDKQETIG